MLPAVITAADPAGTIEHARSVLLAVLTAPRGWSAKRPPGNLPAWFVDAFEPGTPPAVDDLDEGPAVTRLPPAELARVESTRTWTLTGWLEWFEDDRYWFWWDARVSGTNELVAEYVVYDWPAPTGSLVWLWRASGATDVSVV